MTTAVVPHRRSHVNTVTILIALLAIVLASIALAAALRDGSPAATLSPSPPPRVVETGSVRHISSPPAFYGCDRLVGANRC